MMMLQAIAVMEVLHPAFGAVKGGVLAPLMQFLGRGFVLFIVIVPHSDLQSHAAIWWLFGTWSFSEFLRYPYYMLRSYDREWGIVTYVRYTAWIVLYPMGFVCEGYIMLESLAFFDRSGRFTLQLPNAANMSFNFPAFLRLYMLAFLPGALMLTNHMYVQRKKKISPAIWQREQAKKKAKLGNDPLVFSQKVEKAE